MVVINRRFLILVNFLCFFALTVRSITGYNSDVNNWNNETLPSVTVCSECAAAVDNTPVETQPKLLKRRRRHLGFKLGSRIFFRLNIKDNVIKINQLWAHAFGFRANYDILYPVPQHVLRKRDVHETLAELINQHGFDGRACILRAVCEASKMVTPESGIFFKLFKMVFSNSKNLSNSNDSSINANRLPDDVDKVEPYLDSNNCDELNAHCPLSLLELSTYTDDV